MLKTLHLTNAFHESSGGIATFYRALMQTANELGRSMILVVPGDADSVEHIGDHVRIYRVQAPKSAIFDKRYRVLLPNKYLPKASRLREILLAERPDVVEICDKYALNYLGGVLRKNWMLELRRPLVVGLSCERMDDNLKAWLSRSRLARAFANWYMRVIYHRLFDEHIANSEYTAGELRPTSGAYYPPRGIHVLPMGVDLDRFSADRRADALRQALTARLNIPARSALAFYAGRLSPEKNIPLLATSFLAAAAQRPDLHLLIAGAGPLESWLKDTCEAAAPGRAHFLGHLSSEDLANLYANVDVFIHPNPREPFGIAPLEAMASGTSVVVPNQGGVTSYTDLRNSFAAEPTTEAFTDAILDALTPTVLRDQRRTNALATARSLAWPRVARMFFDLYDQLYVDSVARFDTMPVHLRPAAKRQHRIQAAESK